MKLKILSVVELGRKRNLLIENIIIHPIQLTSREPGERWYPGQHIGDGGCAQVSGGDVQLLQGGGLLPLCRSHVVTNQPSLLQQQAPQVLAALQ